MPTILIASGRERGARFEFDEAVTLGRAAENQVRLVDSQISRYHARLEPVDGGWEVVDLGSRNGVIIGDRRIQRALMAPGDSFIIGSITITFEPPPGVSVDPAGTGNLVLLVDTPLDPVTKRHSLAPASEDPSETLDLSHLIVARDRLEAVLDVYGLLGRERDPEQLAARLATRVRGVLAASSVALLTPSRRADTGDTPTDYVPLGTAAVSAASTIIVSRKLIDEAVRTQEGVQSKIDLGPEPAGGGAAQGGLQSVMAAPLLSSGQVIAMLHVARAMESTADAFEEQDLALLSVFAGQAGPAVETALAHRSTLAANRALRQQIHSSLSIVGGSPALAEVLRQARLAARGSSTVLVLGETGSGKELLARLVHEESPRHQRPFVAVNCAAIVEGLLESELFGHERGAFTGAERSKKGQLEVADGGTFFLDEIGEMDPHTQKKLLRVLEERCFTRVGGTRLISVDIRIVAATNRDLEAAVRDGSFREDLYYRVSVIPLRLPPLRERRSDILSLVEHFLEQLGRKAGRRLHGVSDAARAALEHYTWPGNIRELRNVVERAVVLGQGDVLCIADLPPEIRGPEIRGEAAGRAVAPPRSDETDETELRLSTALAHVEQDCIARALEKAGGNKSEASRLLGISRPTLDRKIKDHGIDWDKKQ